MYTFQVLQPLSSMSPFPPSLLSFPLFCYPHNKRNRKYEGIPSTSFPFPVMHVSSFVHLQSFFPLVLSKINFLCIVFCGYMYSSFCLPVYILPNSCIFALSLLHLHAYQASYTPIHKSVQSLT